MNERTMFDVYKEMTAEQKLFVHWIVGLAIFTKGKIGVN